MEKEKKRIKCAKIDNARNPYRSKLSYGENKFVLLNRGKFIAG